MKWVVQISVVALIVAIVTIDGAGQILSLPGPGITVDESFNIDVGWFIVEAEREYGLAALSPASQTEIFGFEGYNPDHPPLGRVLLGLSNTLLTAVLNPDVSSTARWSVSAARFASAFAYAATVCLVGWFTWRATSRSSLAAATAAIVCATTPRVFGHAHLASLESFIGLAFAGCVFWLADRCAERLTWQNAAIGGLLWGLALLTKIQAVLIPIPFAIWGLWHFRTKAILPGATFGVVGIVTFLIGWPWLWIDPVGHLLEYFGRGSDRIELNVFFAGSAYGDRHVPMLYTVIMFLVTVPLLWQILACYGVSTCFRKDDAIDRRRWQLIFGAVVFVLVFFTLPNIAVYDGVRLFLIVYPLWACLAGVGAAAIWNQYGPRLRERWPVVFGSDKPNYGVIAVAFGWLVFSGPFWLSHYSLAVGGLPGATALGFEASYWGDSLTRRFWEKAVAEIPPGSTVAVSPVLHQFQLGVLKEQVPVLANAEVELVPYAEDDRGVVEADYLIAFRRKANESDAIGKWFEEAVDQCRVVESSWGVPLAILAPLDRHGDTPAKQ